MANAMSLRTVLEALRVAGATMRLDGEQLKVTAPNGLTEELRQAIRENKPALVEHLSGRRQQRTCFDCGQPVSIACVCNSCWEKRYARDGDSAIRVLSAEMAPKPDGLGLTGGTA